MLMLSVCKLLTDLLLFFIVAELFFASELTFRLIFLSLIGCTLGYGLKKVHVLFLGFGLLPVADLLWKNVEVHFWQILLVLVPFIYTIYLGRKKAVEEYLGDLSLRFLFYLIGAVCVTVAGQIYDHPAYDFILLFLYAVLGIFTLQVFRLYQGGGLTVKRTALVTFLMIGICGMILLIASPVIWNAVAGMMQWMYFHVVFPILDKLLKLAFFLLGLLFQFILWITELLHIKAGGFLTDAPAMLQADAARDYLIYHVTQEKSVFLTVISIVVFLGMAFLFLRILRGRRLEVPPSFIKSSETMAAPVKREKLSHGNIGEIRRKYRRMLQKMKKQGAKINESSTTEDVALEGLAYYSAEETERIKEEYRPIRYGRTDKRK